MSTRVREPARLQRQFGGTLAHPWSFLLLTGALMAACGAAEPGPDTQDDAGSEVDVMNDPTDDPSDSDVAADIRDTTPDAIDDSDAQSDATDTGADSDVADSDVTDLDAADADAGTCGDNVVGANEACDSDDPACVDCAWVCEDECAPPVTHCDAGDRITYSGPGVCGAAGVCDFGGVAERMVCEDGTACQDGACVVVASAPVEGDLLITEFMANPATVADSAGEWLEIVNVADVPIQLSGLRVEDEGSDGFTIIIEANDPLTAGLAPGDTFVVARSADTGVNGGVVADFEWRSFSLSNEEDEIVLRNGSGNIVDRVAYGRGFPLPVGASAQLSSTSFAADNNLGRFWCAGVQAMPDGDFGTPGSANGPCGCPTTQPIRDDAVRACDTAVVEHVIDGDTIDLRTPTGFITVRMAGYSAPECFKHNTDVDGDTRRECSSDDEPYGVASFDVLEGLVDGQAVVIRCDGAGAGNPCPTGTFGRPLVFLQLPDGRDVVEALASSGAGFAFTDFASTSHARVCAAESESQLSGIGIWASGGPDVVIPTMSARTQAWYPEHDAICAEATSGR